MAKKNKQKKNKSKKINLDKEYAIRDETRN